MIHFLYGDTIHYRLIDELVFVHCEVNEKRKEDMTMAMRSLVNGTSSFSSGHNQTNWICMGSIRKINCFVDFTHMTHYEA